MVLDYSRFEGIDDDEDEDDFIQTKMGKHNQSMQVIHDLLRRVDPDVSAPARSCAWSARARRALRSRVAPRPHPQITNDAATTLVLFITTQHRGGHANNLRRCAEISSLLSARRELLCKRAAERLLRLGQACVDEDATRPLGGAIDCKAMLRVATEALNTLMLVLVEGEGALARLSRAGADERLLQRYLRLEYASLLLAAGHPDRCAHFLPHVPYGDVRDLAAGSRQRGGAASLLGLGPRALAAVLALSAVGAGIALHYYRRGGDSMDLEHV